MLESELLGLHSGAESWQAISKRALRSKRSWVKLKMKVIWSTTDPAEASVFSALLGQVGIACTVENEGSAFYAMGMPTSVVPLNIAVQDSDAERAQGIIQDFVQKKRLSGEASRDSEGAFEKSVQAGRRRWVWMFVLGYAVPIAIILAAVAATGWENATHSAAWMTGALLIFLFVSIGLWATKRRKAKHHHD